MNSKQKRILRVHTHSGVYDDSNENGMVIADGGAISFVDGSRFYRDIFFNVSAMKLGVGAPPGAALEGTFPTLDFDDTTEQEVFIVVHSPHDYATGTDIKMHIEFFVDTVDAVNEQTVCWAVEYKIIEHGDIFVFTGTGTTYKSHPIPITTSDKGLMTCDHLTIPYTALSGEGILLMRLYRDAGGALDTDSQTGDARVVHAHLHYTADKLGEEI